MLKQTTPFQCVVVCPGLGSHVGLAIGASQSGGVGVLDLEFHNASAMPRLRRHLQQMLRRLSTTQPFGLRCRSSDLEKAVPLLEAVEGRAHYLILHGDHPSRLAAAGATHRRASCLGLWVEVNDVIGVAHIASPQSGVDAVIACGQECGGQVSTLSSFLLTQRLLAAEAMPVLVRGISGVRGAAACRAVGAVGVVLDHQTLLMPESPLPLGWQRLIETAGSQDFQMLGGQGVSPVTILAHPTFSALPELQKAARELELEGPDAQARFDSTVQRLVRLGPPDQYLWPLGQAASWAAWTRDNYSSIGHLVKAVLEGSQAQVATAAVAQPLSEGAPLALSHRTRFPVVQGPMTRVSDQPLFARAVADSGALPMVALALCKGRETRAILEETSALLGDAPWGVGLLGFVTPDILDVQLQEIARVKPPFALIAGGRPRQAAALEEQGIATYLHVPVPSLLASFLEQGARRFIFEGRECGGHVGPLSSFVLWEQAVETMLARLPKGQKASVLFAGGIHDARSAAMVSALAAPLVAIGVEVGVLMGTAYLFTSEAVSTGAISQAFQDAALNCRRTVTLDSAVGHANRCADTPFARKFYEEKKALLRQGASAQQIHKELDDLLLGRLRLASKGVKRDESGVMVSVDSDQQVADGMFMMGEVAALRHHVLSMEQLHLEVCRDSATRFFSTDVTGAPQDGRAPQAAPCDVAIVGIALHVPGALEKDEFWSHLLACTPAIVEIPESRWDWRKFFDEDRHAPDASYSKWGGFVDDFIFDPLAFGMPPNTWDGINSSQVISLELARRALEDAGYLDRPFSRERTSTILASGDTGMFGSTLLTRSLLHLLMPTVPQEMLDRLPAWQDDSLPGLLASLCAGRVANRLNLGGSNFIVDSACASSLTAVDMSCRELASGRADNVIVGGVDIATTPFDFVSFAKVQALSPSGVVRPFDQGADGIVISEGACFMMLKRLADAERDGDRVYAVIRAVGTSSDGRSAGMTAPCSAGQGRALEVAWELSGLDPATLELYEAHATGTSLGDSTELKSINNLLARHDAPAQQCAVGSVKSLLGHTKRAAGLVSLAKTALSLYHGVLPPHQGVETPLETLRSAQAPVCIHQQPQPWFRRQEQRRRAAVSAFGFGGTNAHAVLEEAIGSRDAAPGAAAWPAELILLEEQPGFDLPARVQALRRSLDGAEVSLRDLAFSLTLELTSAPNAGLCTAMLVESVDELKRKLAELAAHLENPEQAALPANVRLERRRGNRVGGLGFLFPGQGSQYPSPARELALYFPELRDALQETGDQLEGCYRLPFTRLAYPPAAFGAENEEAQRRQLRDTHLAQPLLGALSSGSFRLMKRLGFNPDCLAGHSYGEFAALHCADVMSQEDLIALSEARGRAMGNLCGDSGTMAAVSAKRSHVEEFLTPGGAVVVANHNSPDQTVIAGPSQELAEVIARLKEANIRTVSLAVSGGFHSPIMAPASEELVKTIRTLSFSAPSLPVYSNLNGRPYPVDPTAVVEQMQEHLLSSVEFVAQIQSMSRAGVRTFVEMAPSAILSGLVKEILDEPDVLITAMDRRGGGLRAFLSMLGQLRCAGVPFWPVALFDGRPVRRVDPFALPKKAALKPTSWIVNASYIRPASDPEPKLGKLPFLANQPGPNGEPAKIGFNIVPTVDDLGGKISALPGTTPPVGAAPQAVVPAVAATPVPSVASSPVPLSPVAPPVKNPAPPAARTGNPNAVPRVVKPVEQSTSNNGYSHHYAAPPSGLGDHRVVEAYHAYQQTMQQFLRTQENVMAGFLQSLSGRPASPAMPYPAPVITAPPLATEPQAPEPVAPVVATPVVEAPTPAPVIEAAPTATQVATVLDRGVIEQALVRIVARRTGYPPEMLELQSDLEGHLGIDSIKRLEIVEDLLTNLAQDRSEDLREAAEGLIRLRTLSELAASLLTLLAQPQPPSAQPDEVSTSAQSCPRYVMEATVSQPPTVGAPIAGLVLIVGGEAELAANLAAKLGGDGDSTLILPAGQPWQTIIPEQGAISAVISLAGLSAEAPPNDLLSLRRQTAEQVKDLFALLQMCGPQRLARSLLLVASRHGGDFGRSSGSQGQGHGSLLAAGALGLCRTLATEWPRARCIGVDIEDGLDHDATTSILQQELYGSDPEVGYRQGVRSVYAPVARELQDGPGLQPAADWVMLATGGARGITARLALDTAKPGMRVILVGRTSTEPEDPTLAKLGNAEELRAHFISQSPRSRSPLEIERTVQAVLRSREVARTLAAFAEKGCSASYHAVDSCDPVEFPKLIEEIYRQHGRLDVVFHGAGVIEDKLMQDKSEESFDRVFGTKIDSLLLLSQALKPDSLKALVLFSSVAGRFGNRGQCDYAAANEVLNRWGCRLRQQWPATLVISAIWGPWAGDGMAAAGHGEIFAARGIQPIAPPEGVQFLSQELAHGESSPVEVVAGAGDWAGMLQSTAMISAQESLSR